MWKDECNRQRKMHAVKHGRDRTRFRRSKCNAGKIDLNRKSGAYPAFAGQHECDVSTSRCTQRFKTKASSTLKKQQQQQQQQNKKQNKTKTKKIDCHFNILPNTGQENNLAQPKADKWFRFSLHFSFFCLFVFYRLAFV